MMAKLAAPSALCPDGRSETLTLHWAEVWPGTFQRKRPVFGATAASSQVLPPSGVYSIRTVLPAGAEGASQVIQCLLSAHHVSPPFGAVSRMAGLPAPRTPGS